MALSEETGEAANPWPAKDNACSRCRERKIRCGRERPNCANCKRDGVACGYSTPGKRVNHIKLLCNSVGGLDHRLNNIEAELSRMNTLLKAKGSQVLPTGAATEDDNSGGMSAYDSFGENHPGPSPTDRHIVGNSSNYTDRYHGPCTLLALCNEFCDTLLSIQRIQPRKSAGEESHIGRKHNKPMMNDAEKDLLDKLCLDSSHEESLDLQVEFVPITLPPKQILLMTQTDFFQQADYATDIFVQRYFWSNMEEVYGRPFTTADEAWAICYNTLILLVLGPESLSRNFDSQIASNFAQPYLLIVRSAICNLRVLMEAKLVNVQALALLSLAAQKYYPPGIAESIFAQACILAKTMGLHQACPLSEGVSSEEARGRSKVFTSLYLRDKSSSVSRGSICWLPSFECSLSSEPDESGSADPHLAIRIQLAALEDEIYRLLNTSRQSSTKYKIALQNIERGLGRWTDANALFNSRYAGTRDVDLQLEFLAARICILRKSPELSHCRQALSDSRASCLLIVISYGMHELSMIDQLDTILCSKSLSENISKGVPGGSSKSGKGFSPDSTVYGTSEYAPSRFRNLLGTFSVPAFFLLAMNLVWPSSAYDESKAEDLDLLKRTCACFQEHNARNQAGNHTRKVGRAFETLLEIVKLIRDSERLQASQFSTQSTDYRDTPSKSNHLDEQYRLSELSSLPTHSASLVPSISWESYSFKNDSATPASMSIGASPGLLPPIDWYHQPYDPPQPNLLSPHMQQQQQQTRPQTSASDVSMHDDANSMRIQNF